MGGILHIPPSHLIRNPNVQNMKENFELHTIKYEINV